MKRLLAYQILYIAYARPSFPNEELNVNDSDDMPSHHGRLRTRPANAYARTPRVFTVEQTEVFFGRLTLERFSGMFHEAATLIRENPGGTGCCAQSDIPRRIMVREPKALRKFTLVAPVGCAESARLAKVPQHPFQSVVMLRSIPLVAAS
jgi:hypothetical protein